MENYLSYLHKERLKYLGNLNKKVDWLGFDQCFGYKGWD